MSATKYRLDLQNIRVGVAQEFDFLTKRFKPGTQLAFFINLQRAVIGPLATLTGR